MGFEHKCVICNNFFPQISGKPQVEVNHKIEIGGFSKDITKWAEDLGQMYQRTLCAVDGLEVVCKPCHRQLTNDYLKEKAGIKSLTKEFPREYGSYRAMLSRCYNPKNKDYKYYGGRGISVDERWRTSFVNFYADMGGRSEETSLDRVDFNGNYTKLNCRWATWVEQARNRSNNVYLAYGEDCLCLAEWGVKLDIVPHTISYRLDHGWTIPQALGFEERPSKTYTGRLTLEELEELIKERSQGIELKVLGEKYSIAFTQVSRLYKKYKHLFIEQEL